MILYSSHTCSIACAKSADMVTRTVRLPQHNLATHRTSNFIQAKIYKHVIQRAQKQQPRYSNGNLLDASEQTPGTSSSQAPNKHTHENFIIGGLITRPLFCTSINLYLNASSSNNKSIGSMLRKFMLTSLSPCWIHHTEVPRRNNRDAGS